MLSGLGLGFGCNVIFVIMLVFFLFPLVLSPSTLPQSRLVYCCCVYSYGIDLMSGMGDGSRGGRLFYTFYTQTHTLTASNTQKFLFCLLLIWTVFTGSLVTA